MSITVKEDGTFTVAGIKFIKFPAEGDRTPVMAKDILFSSRFGSNNDLRSSDVLKKMEEDVIPKVIEAIGEETVLTFKTDLTTEDGLKPYGEMESKISLPTLDFYRANVEIFDKHKVSTWFWLATPESAQPHCDPDWVLCVAPSGRFNCVYYDCGIGVRPFLYFHSSIFESFGE
jgi:hypothetical protein